jgi:hypothetical protein
MRKFSTRHEMNTTPRPTDAEAAAPRSAWALFLVDGNNRAVTKSTGGDTMHAATEASVLMRRFIAVSHFGDSLRRYRETAEDAHVRRAIPAQHFTSATS